MESVSIFAFACVEPEGLLIKVTEHMKRLDRNIGAFNAPLEQTPKVLKSVRVNGASNILFGVVNELMNVVSTQAKIRTMRVRHYLAAAFDIPYVRCNEPETLERALKDHAGRGGPTLIEVRVGTMPSPWHLLRLVPPPFAAGRQAAPNPLGEPAPREAVA